jgi:hypothetical protein
MSINRMSGTTVHMCFCCLLFIFLVNPEPAVGIDFLVPGVSLASVSFNPGARVRYLVTSEALGSIDSSEVELAVLECHTDEVFLEISTTQIPKIEEESVTVRMRLDRRVTSILSPAEFKECVREILIREGTEQFRVPSEDEIADYEFDRVFRKREEDTVRRDLGTERIETAAGAFDCDIVELSRRDLRAVQLGGIDAQRVEEEVSTVWLSGDVPFWGMVKSTVEHRRETRLLTDSPPVTLAPHTTITASILVHYVRGEEPKR